MKVSAMQGAPCNAIWEGERWSIRCNPCNPCAANDRTRRMYLVKPPHSCWSPAGRLCRWEGTIREHRINNTTAKTPVR
jgi:hypothetical protein